MSQQIQQIKQQKILQLMPYQWTLWLYFRNDNKNEFNYENNIMKIQKVKYWNDFAYLWNWFSKTQKFFINPQNGSYSKLKFGNQQRKIDSINFFKQDIQPQWQYGENSKYGYFNFQIEKNQQRVNEIFEATVFLGTGGIQQLSQYIIGTRIVDLGARVKHPSRARIQMWVNFRHNGSAQSMDKLLYYQKNLINYYQKNVNYDISQVRFFNISNQDTGQNQKNKNKNQNKQNKYSSNIKQYNNKKPQYVNKK